jgi:hypothetical protein
MLTYYCDKGNYLIFKDYLDSLGIKPVHERPEEADVYVYRVPECIPITPETILLNTEQMTRNELIPDERIRHIYDYSEENIEIMRLLDPYRKYKHLAYKENPNEILEIAKTKWFAMIGNNSPRRHKMKHLIWGLDNITGWGNDRDTRLFEYRVLINVHYDEMYKIVEQLRINRCVYNKMIVISERGTYPELIKLKKGIIYCDYNEIPKVALEVKLNYDRIYSEQFESI